MLKITTFTSALAATVATSGAIGIISAPITFAETTTQTIGSEGKLVDGNVIQAWTIRDLKPSTDVIPYQVIGTLWEATATDEAIQGAATPIVSNLNARAESGQTYRALFGVATPQGVNPATLGQGQETTGKVYFDVTGDKPESVVYNAGGQDLLVWVQPPPSPPQSGGTRSSTPYQSASPATSAPATTTPAPAPAAAEATPAPTTTPVVPPPAPAGSQGTPLPLGSQGTPLPAGSQGAPLPVGSQGTPLPAGSQSAPLPVGSQGTPLPPGAEATPVPPMPPGAPRPASIQEVPAPAAPALAPAAPAPVPAPEGSQGTPLAPGSEATPPLTEGTPVTPTPTTTPVPAP